MGFLDNLENDLKAMERSAERDPATAARQQAAREAERAAALAAAPHAAQLRDSKFTAELLNHAVMLGRARRLAVRMLWVGSTLRLQAREHSLELRPTAEGVRAHFLKGGAEKESVPVDFSRSPEELARQWFDAVEV